MARQAIADRHGDIQIFDAKDQRRVIVGCRPLPGTRAQVNSRRPNIYTVMAYLHDWQASFWTDVAESWHACAVTDDSDCIPLIGISVDQFWVGLNDFTGRGNTECISYGKIIETVGCADEYSLDLPSIERNQFHCIR